MKILYFFLVMVFVVAIGVLLLIGIGYLIECLLYLLFDFELNLWLVDKYEAIVNNKKMRNTDKKLKNRQKELENKLLKKSTIKFETLKFEYNTVYNIVNTEIEKLKTEEYIINELYLIILHDYYQNILKIRPVERNSLEFFSCVQQALIEEPIFLDLKGTQTASLRTLNAEVIQKVLEALKKKYNYIYYNDVVIEKENVKTIKAMSYADYRTYFNKIHCSKIFLFIFEHVEEMF